MSEFEEMEDKYVLAWAVYHAKEYQEEQRKVVEAQSKYEKFLAEVIERGLLDDLVERLENG